jgi:hypothetical protein
MAADFLSPLPLLRVPYQGSIHMIPAGCQIRLLERAWRVDRVYRIPLESKGFRRNPNIARSGARKVSVTERPGEEVELDLEPQPERLDDEHGDHEDREQHVDRPRHRARWAGRTGCSSRPAETTLMPSARWSRTWGSPSTCSRRPHRPGEPHHLGPAPWAAPTCWRPRLWCGGGGDGDSGARGLDRARREHAAELSAPALSSETRARSVSLRSATCRAST